MSRYYHGPRWEFEEPPTDPYRFITRDGGWNLKKIRKTKAFLDELEKAFKDKEGEKKKDDKKPDDKKKESNFTGPQVFMLTTLTSLGMMGVMSWMMITGMEKVLKLAQLAAKVPLQ